MNLGGSPGVLAAGSTSARNPGHPCYLGGGRSRARTCDPGLVRAVLFQLSYPPRPMISHSYGDGVRVEDPAVSLIVSVSFRAASCKYGQSSKAAYLSIYTIGSEASRARFSGGPSDDSATRTAAPSCSVSGGVTSRRSRSFRPPRTSTVVPKSRPSWTTGKRTLSSSPTTATRGGPDRIIRALDGITSGGSAR